MTPLEDARNLGPTTAAELATVGIATLEHLRAIGWAEAFERWIVAYPERLNLNALTALIGAVEDEDWRRLPADRQTEARALVQELRASS